ncbi:MAG: hypothetical protein WA435_02180 [Gallionellaceae bacterium]
MSGYLCKSRIPGDADETTTAAEFDNDGLHDIILTKSARFNAID